MRKTILTGGILGEYYTKIKEHFLYGIDNQIHISAYENTHGFWHAEPEFAGKYLETCMRYYMDSQDEAFLKNAEAVVEGIISSCDKSGHVDGLNDENVWKAFSVWNQTFTVRGLMMYWRVTKDRRALAVCEKTVENIAHHYMDNEDVDILDSLNDGTQHISILLVLPDMYKITNKSIYKDFADFIINKMKEGNLDFTSFDSIMQLRSKKGIENFVIMIGLIRYSEVFGDTSVLNGIEKYWEQLRETQINNTGCGTLKELWTEVGNAPAMLDVEDKPNENCVAVGWVELSYLLYLKRGHTKYLDAIEKTLFNHILGGVSREGTDFAYYQPNYGKKVLSTRADLYKCCRYRGYMLFSYLPSSLYHSDASYITPLIYTNSEYCENNLTIKQISDYPFEEKISFEIVGTSDKKLKLRIPEYCKAYTLKINEETVKLPITDGYVIVDIDKAMSISLSFKTEFNITHAVIDNIPRMSISYGAVLLALDSSSEKNIWAICLSSGAVDNIERHNSSTHYLEFTCDGLVDGNKSRVVLVDYCSAAKNNPEDEFLVWIPEGE